jgi:hypothetical protein
MYRQSNGLLTSALSQPAYEAMVPNYDACLQKSSCPEHFEKLAYMVTPLGKCFMCNGSAFSDATVHLISQTWPTQPVATIPACNIRSVKNTSPVQFCITRRMVMERSLP